MKFKVKSDHNRELHFNMPLINARVAMWKPHTEFEVDIVRKRRTVSDPMRRYYFGVVLPMFAKHVGYEPEDFNSFHKQLKILYFNVKPDKYNVYRDVPAVFANDSKLDIKTKNDFREWVQRMAAREGVYIPDPGEE